MHIVSSSHRFEILSIADTISSGTVYSQYIFIHGKRMANSTAMIVEQRLDQIKPTYTTYTSTASEDDVPRL